MNQKDGNILGEPVTTPAGEVPTPATEVVEVPTEDYTRLVELLANEKQARINLQAEIKELRTRKVPETPQSTPTDVELAVEAVLAKRKQDEAQRNRETAIQTFLKEYPQFDTANDPSGLMFDKFQKTLGRLNTSGATTVDDFSGFFKDALGLMGYKPETEEQVPAHLAAFPMGKSPTPSKQGTTLSAREAKVVSQHFGGDEAAYLKAKAKRPDYFETLLEYVK